jgi:S1-C subfamily serine protease
MRIKTIAFSLLPILLAAYALGARTEKVARNSARKVVKVGVVDGKRSACGSGAFITRSGIILTCSHVVNHGKKPKIYIKLDSGEVYTGVVIANDEKADLALIVTTLTDVPYFALGGDVRRGQEVVAFGSPLGIQRTVSFGWVENITEKGSIIHSAAINPGNSGGPLVDMKGRLVGVNQFTIEYDLIRTAQGMGGAIPVRDVKAFLKGVLPWMKQVTLL